MNVEPKVIFVILNWNQAEMTAACLKSIMEQKYSNFEVVLVDNGSKDHSGEQLKAKFPGIKLIHNPFNIGYSAGNNEGIKKALEIRSEYIFLLNNDTEVDPDMLKLLVEAAESDPRVGVVGPTQYYYDPPDMIWSGANFIDWKNASIFRKDFGVRADHALVSQQTPEITDVVDTCAALIRSEALRKSGGMDERYFINYDDHDLNLRIRKEGFSVLYVPQARMWHKVSATMGLGSPTNTYYLTRNSMLFFYLHSPGRRKFINVTKIFLRTFRTIGAWTLKSCYQTEIFRKRRNANLLAIRDFILGRLGGISQEV